MDISARPAQRVVDFLEKKVADLSLQSCDILIHLYNIYNFSIHFPSSINLFFTNSYALGLESPDY